MDSGLIEIRWTGEQIVAWLREEREEKLALLWREADDTRHRRVGDEVHLRGLIEISNHCVRQCHYCGLRAGNEELRRYRMTEEEIMACVARGGRLRIRHGRHAVGRGRGDHARTGWPASSGGSAGKRPWP